MSIVLGTILGVLAGLLIRYIDPLRAKGGIKAAVILGAVGGFLGSLFAYILRTSSGIQLFTTLYGLILAFLSIGLGAIAVLGQRIFFNKEKGVKTIVTGGNK